MSAVDSRQSSIVGRRLLTRIVLYCLRVCCLEDNAGICTHFETKHVQRQDVATNICVSTQTHTHAYAYILTYVCMSRMKYPGTDLTICPFAYPSVRLFVCMSLYIFCLCFGWLLIVVVLTADCQFLYGLEQYFFACALHSASSITRIIPHSCVPLCRLMSMPCRICARVQVAKAKAEVKN